MGRMSQKYSSDEAVSNGNNESNLAQSVFSPVKLSVMCPPVLKLDTEVTWYKLKAEILQYLLYSKGGNI